MTRGDVSTGFDPSSPTVSYRSDIRRKYWTEELGGTFWMGIHQNRVVPSPSRGLDTKLNRPWFPFEVGHDAPDDPFGLFEDDRLDPIDEPSDRDERR